MSKISNALTMLELLNNNRKYSINELAERLEVTPRMIRIYKQDLENAGIYIGTIKGPHGGYVLSDNVFLPQRGFSKYDVELLKEISEILSENKEFKFSNELEELTEKVSGIYKASKRKADQEIMCADNNTKYNIISEAIKQKRKLNINFLSLDRSVKNRTIHPCNLFLYNEEWYVSAFCELRGEIRHFAFSRILKLDLLKISYEN